MQSHNNVKKFSLNNGMTVLVCPTTTIPKVSTQLWYSVGSKDEQSRERGLAHLIEHMIFKGTNRLSESDINEITHKLSGMCNAFTSYDYTGYLFDFPSQNWQEALPIMADCMRNCTFKEEHLNSEMKAVIQELKMYKDNYTSVLIEAMMAAIFTDHPYHHPIIGYKQDLWSVKRDALLNFYKKHYVPNNATLIVVGDVKADEVYQLAQKHFGNIPADSSYQHHSYYHSKDLVSHRTVLYRSVQQPLCILGFVVPGSREKKEFIFEVLTWILACGKGSRLYRILVDELELLTEIEGFLYDLFDEGLFFIEFQPKHAQDIDLIIKRIHEEIAHIIHDGVTQIELRRGIKKAETDLLTTLESNQKQAYLIGKFFLATGDENYLSSFVERDAQKVEFELIEILRKYFNSSTTHVGILLPLLQNEKMRWDELQEISDKEDARILAGRTRQAQVEPAEVAQTIPVQKPKSFNYPRYQTFMLSNGLEVLYFQNTKVPKIEILLELKAKSYYDPENLLGLNTLMSALLLEGTSNYTAQQLAEEIESYGMTLLTSPGYISLSMLTPDAQKGFGLLAEILRNSVFDEKALEKIRAILLADIRDFWDKPTEFSGDLVRQLIYKGHPFSKNKLGTLETVTNITRNDVLNSYKSFISPQGARIAIVGDFNNYDLKKLLESTLGQWQGPQVEDIKFPVLQAPKGDEVVYNIARDQIVLIFAGLSVERANPDYDKLLLFDQILCGGVLGSMSSRLFQLREQTGLFYTIGGSTITQSGEQPGMVFIRTIVSPDRLQEAVSSIKETLETVIDDITQEELESARNALINSMVDNFETDRAMVVAFITMAKYKLPADYFDKRAQNLEKITLAQVKEAARNVLSSDKLVLFKVGRVK